MLHRVPISLNAISHDAAADLVRHVLAQGVNVTQVFVDTVGDATSYQNKLTRMFGGRISFTVSKKADSLFKTVSAASIAAKVTRDRVLKAWVFKEKAFAHVTRSASAAADGGAPAAHFSDDEGDDADDAGGGGAGATAAKRKRSDSEDDGGAQGGGDP